MVYVLSGQPIDADDQEGMPEHAADDGASKKGSASICPFVYLRLRDPCANAVGAPPDSQPSDEYRQQAASRCDDFRLERPRKTCPIHLIELKYIAMRDIGEWYKKYKDHFT
jgi:hypothetical protein